MLPTPSSCHALAAAPSLLHFPEAWACRPHTSAACRAQEVRVESVVLAATLPALSCPVPLCAVFPVCAACLQEGAFVGWLVGCLLLIE